MKFKIYTYYFQILKINFLNPSRAAENLREFSQRRNQLISAPPIS